MELVTSPSRNAMLLRAITNIVFGLLVLLFPGLSVLVLAYFFAISVMIVGLFMIFEPAIDNNNKHAALTVILGLVTIGAAVFVMSRPLVGITVLSYLIAAWALFYGLIDMFIGFKLTDIKEKGGWIFVVVGLLSIIFAIYLVFNPLEGSLAIAWVIGLYALVMGLLFGFQAYRLKPAKKATQKSTKKTRKGKK